MDPDGKVYVADTAFANFQIFDPEGRILMFIGNRNETGGPGAYILPAGITVDVDGRVYVVDQFFRKVEVFRPVGLPEGSPVDWLRRNPPHSLLACPDGDRRDSTA